MRCGPKPRKRYFKKQQKKICLQTHKTCGRMQRAHCQVCANATKVLVLKVAFQTQSKKEFRADLISRNLISRLPQQCPRFWCEFTCFSAIVIIVVALLKYIPVCYIKVHSKAIKCYVKTTQGNSLVFLSSCLERQSKEQQKHDQLSVCTMYNDNQVIFI